MNKFLVHVPHASLELPLVFFEKIIMDKSKVIDESRFLGDILVDEFVPDGVNVLKFPYSRMFCDVERFRCDSDEVMSKIGQGAVYVNTSKMERFISYDEEYKEYVLSNFYDVHHRRLEDMTEKIIDKYGEAYIIDLHSFSDELVKRLLGLEENPDICIGVEEEFNSSELTDYTIKYFENFGYSVKINYPYKGTMVPTKYYLSNDKRVKSIMIEINKRIYMNEKYEEFKEIIFKYFNNLSLNFDYKILKKK